MKKLLLPGILLCTMGASAQLYIDNATFFIDNGAVVTVQGDVFSNTDIQVNGASGTGKIRLGGTSSQNVNLNGKIVPNLQVDNTAGVVLTGAAKIGNSLEFTNGKIQLGNFDLTLASTSTFTGVGAGKFAETNGTGIVKKEVTAAGNHTLPVGNGSNYSPLTYQLTGGTYSSAWVGARSIGTAHPNKHPRSSDYLNNYWKLTSAGITGGTKVAVGTYTAPTGVTGAEASVIALYWNGSSWVKGTSQDAAAHTVTASVAADGQDLYGMNKFLLVSPKVFLQGAFNTSTGLMNDALRTSAAYSPGNYPASNLIPLSDPYRVAPYNTAFTHVANTVAETITTDVLKDLANPNDQIVDWVFVELRNKTSNTTAPVIQTRSALVQRDGDIVDIDGTSPVYFKNVDAGSNYVISVRHRNHLGLSSNPASALSLGLNTTLFDFTNTGNTAAIYGSAGTNYVQAGSTLKNLLWAGNANSNANTRYTGPSNDKDYLLVSSLSGNVLNIINNTYNAGDINMNRTVRYTGPSNDKDFLLVTPLSGSVLNIRSQLLPN
jgi:hypothetical protein